MTYKKGTYLLNGIQAGEVIGYMGNTGANTTGAHAHMSLNGNGDLFANVFNKEYYFEKESFKKDSYAKNMSGYNNKNYFNNPLLLYRVKEYSKSKPDLFDYDNFYKQHYIEQLYSKYPEGK